MINKNVLPALKIILYIYLIISSICVVWLNELRYQEIQFELSCVKSELKDINSSMDRNKSNISKLEFNINDLRIKFNEIIE